MIQAVMQHPGRPNFGNRKTERCENPSVHNGDNIAIPAESKECLTATLAKMKTTINRYDD